MLPNRYGYSEKTGRLDRELQDAGCQPGDLGLIIITHGHTDHVGNAAYLRDKYGGQVAMHKGDYAMIESGNMFADTKGGVVVVAIGFVMKILGLSSFDKFTSDMYLEDNQDLSTHGLNATIVHIPGHSEGSIGVLTADRDLFCGDLLVNTDRPAKNTLIDDSAQMDASIERMRTLQIRTVYPGHGKPFQMQQYVENRQ